MQSIKLTDVLFLLCAGKRSSDISRSYDVIAGFPVAPSVSRRKTNREVPFNGEMKKTQNITKQNSLKAVRTNVLNLLISSAECKTTKLWQSSASLVFLQSTDFPR